MQILRNFKGAYRTWRTQGWAGVREKVARRLAPENPVGLWDKYGEEAGSLVSWLDFGAGELAASRAVHEQHPGPFDIRSITWFIPDFVNAYYGGMYTILRFADHFTRMHGVSHQFVIVGTMSEPEALQKITSAFPALRGSRTQRVTSHHDFGKLEDTDAGICTLWSTAYFLLRFNRVKRKFYFLQDYEPLFYPAGSTSAQVQATYRFGFYGIVNTPALCNIYRDNYGGVARAFVPCVDRHVFYDDGRKPHADRLPYQVFFYARPGHPRNGFELGAAALRRLKAHMGDAVRIVAAGANWRPEDHHLQGIVENLGMLSYESTADLYRECDAGLVMMFTRHPSYLPFELMACGSLVVSNHNPASTWLLKDGVNCLVTETSATCIADTIERGLKNAAIRARIAEEAARHIRLNHADWHGECEEIYQFACNLEFASVL